MEDNSNNNKEENINNQSETGDNFSDNLSKCLKEKEEYLDGWKRARAEVINYKKDESKRFEMVVKFSQENLMKEIIGVLSSFNLALEAMEKIGTAEKGIYLIKSQLEDVLKQNGLDEVIVSIGQQFNPSFHEVMASVESDKESGIIIEEVEKGYMLNGKLIKPARVKVAK